MRIVGDGVREVARSHSILIYCNCGRRGRPLGAVRETGSGVVVLEVDKGRLRRGIGGG